MPKKNQFPHRDRKNPAMREKWMEQKKKNRLKSRWVWDDEANNIGHWEKTNAANA